MGKEQQPNHSIPEVPECPPNMKENRFRQTINLSIFSGFWHGTYYENGIPRPGGEKLEDGTLLRQGKIYEVKPKKRGK